MEGLYLIWTKEYIDLKKNVYKIGRTENLEQLYQTYKPGHKILFTVLCVKAYECKKKIISIFREKFKLVQGQQYFEGDKDKMIEEIKNIVCSEYKMNHILDEMINIHLSFSKNTDTKQ